MSSQLYLLYLSSFSFGKSILVRWYMLPVQEAQPVRVAGLVVILGKYVKIEEVVVVVIPLVVLAAEHVMAQRWVVQVVQYVITLHVPVNALDQGQVVLNGALGVHVLEVINKGIVKSAPLTPNNELVPSIQQVLQVVVILQQIHPHRRLLRNLFDPGHLILN